MGKTTRHKQGHLSPKEKKKKINLVVLFLWLDVFSRKIKEIKKIVVVVVFF